MDAMKWVLGEQNPRLLRAKKMSDLIFSGDNGRPSHIAEVRLLLEGGDLMPPELAEESQVEIVRRLRRNGDSEYRINGKVCRLKDIQYIFMDTGAGSRTYSIVDQGHVSRFVDMDSQDRRILVEEVAGISRYKVRRAEAQRHMARTRENLQRLEDLLHEINRQWENLSSQAEKTNRYLALKKEQEVLQKRLLAFHWKTCLNRLEELTLTRKRQQGLIDGIQRNIDEKKNRLEDVTLRLNDTEENLEHIRSSMSRAQVYLKDLRAEAAEAQRRLDRILSKKGNLTEQVSSLKRRESALKDQHQALMREISSIRTQKDAQEKEVRASESAVAEVEKIREEILSSMEEIKVRLVDVSARHAKIKGEQRKASERAEQLDQLIKNRGQEKEQNLRELREISHFIREIKDKLHSRSEEILKLRSLADEKRQALEQVNLCLEEVGEALSEKKSSLSAARARQDVFQRMEQDSQGYSQATKLLLASDIPTRGTLADFLEVEEGREVLIETALGDLLQSVILEPDYSLKTVLEFLKQKGVKRARILFPDHTTQPRQPQAPSEECVSLLSMLRAPDFLTSVMHRVLGNWFLVKDIRNALDLNKADRNRCFFVTESREILNPWGEMETRGDEPEERGILKRRSELKRLGVYIEKTEKEIAGLSSKKKDLNEKSRALRQELNDLASESDSLREEVQRLERDLDRHRIRKSGLEERNEILDYEMDQMGGEKSEMELKAQGLEVELESILKEKMETESGLKGRAEALKIQEGVLKRRRNVLERNRLELMRLQTTLASREKDLLVLEKRQKRAREEIARARREAGSLEPGISEIKQELSTARAKVEAQEAALEKADASLSDLQEAHRSLREKGLELREKIDALAEDYRKGEKALHGTDIRLVKVRQDMERAAEVFSRKYRDDLSRCYTAWLKDDFSPATARSRVGHLQKEIDGIGPVNLTAIEEFDELDHRRKDLESQKQDLEASMRDLETAIEKINTESRQRFKQALEQINQQLSRVFPVLFKGGRAELKVETNREAENGRDALSVGIDYLVRLPGKHIQHLGLLSGGEKAMAALALIFAIYLIKPSPFCVLDEVDAPLDHANTERFNKLITEMALKSQVVLITHNQKVMEVADSLYGVTMEKKGVSKLVNIDLKG